MTSFSLHYHIIMGQMIDDYVFGGKLTLEKLCLHHLIWHRCRPSDMMTVIIIIILMTLCINVFKLCIPLSFTGHMNYHSVLGCNICNNVLWITKNEFIFDINVPDSCITFYLNNIIFITLSYHQGKAKRSICFVGQRSFVKLFSVS